MWCVCVWKGGGRFFESSDFMISGSSVDLSRGPRLSVLRPSPSPPVQHFVAHVSGPHPARPGSASAVSRGAPRRPERPPRPIYYRAYVTLWLLTHGG